MKKTRGVKEKKMHLLSNTAHAEPREQRKSQLARMYRDQEPVMPYRETHLFSAVQRCSILENLACSSGLVVYSIKERMMHAQTFCGLFCPHAGARRKKGRPSEFVEFNYIDGRVFRARNRVLSRSLFFSDGDYGISAAAICEIIVTRGSGGYFHTESDALHALQFFR